MTKFREFLKESEEKVYRVRAHGNFYNGKRYETGIDSFFVLANSEKDAITTSNKYLKEITDMFKDKKVYGRGAIAQKDDVLIKVFKAEENNQQTGLRKVLNKSGKFIKL